MPAKKRAPRERSLAQEKAEARREENDKNGKTLIRHTTESARAMKHVQKRMGVTGPEAMRIAIIELAAKRN